MRRPSLSAESQQRVANAKAHMMRTVQEALKQYVAILEQELQYDQVSDLSRCADCADCIQSTGAALEAKASDSAGSAATMLSHASAQSKQHVLG